MNKDTNNQTEQSMPTARNSIAKAGEWLLKNASFYKVYFFFIILFVAATLIGLLSLRSWLVDYEAAQPTAKAQQVFDQMFLSKDWDGIYAAIGSPRTAYEGRDSFLSYMDEKTDGKSLDFLETSAGLSGDKKYIVRANGERIACFTLSNLNSNSESSTALPNWQLKDIELFLDRDISYRFEKLNGHVCKVNGVELDDEHIIQVASSLAEDYLPTGTDDITICTQEIVGLITKPTVEFFDQNGKPAELSYDEQNHTFTELTSVNTIKPDENEAAVNAATTYCLWMIKNITDAETVAKYFDPDEAAYQRIVSTTELWMQSYTAYEFTDTEVSGFVRYSDDLFSVRVSTTLNVTRPDETVKPYKYAQSLIFRKCEAGDWLCITATNVDLTKPVGHVRLSFMLDNELIKSDFYRIGDEEIATPIVPAPEGKVLCAWVQPQKTENAAEAYKVIFEPDDNGIARVPAGMELSPMTLYAYFQDAA